ncbi:MAG: 4-hydroxy-tetrahydrodipicolinate reductase [Clostridia bacterium]|nr:4-hydroxy-tetrahydrodipicolinate reductase [Clostridia bacterium]
MTDIILCGALGKMGRVVSEIVNERDDCRIVAGVDLLKSDVGFPIFSAPALIDVDADVIIDFSHPSALSGVLEFAVAKNMPVVLATTGYEESQISLIKKASERIPVFFTANMSLGVNLLCELAKTATKILSSSFDIEIVEMHHNKKIDAPSGTALMLADEISSAMENDPEYVYARHDKREKRTKNEIGIHAVRGGTIVGEHEIIFAGTDEVIKLSHSAGSKRIFASGAVNAAIWINAKTECGLYSMKDVVSLN